MTRAAIYTRISRDTSGRKLGVERQETDCRAICADEALTVVDVYSDNDISASDAKKDRPAYRRMMADVKAGLVDCIVLYDPDRLHRQPIELEQFIADYTKAGLSLVYTDSHGLYDLTKPDDEFQFRTAGANARREAGKMSRRIQRKKLQSAQAGLPSGGARPFGYMNVAKGVQAIREDEAALVREAAAKILEGASLTSIRNEWIDREIPTVTGARWSIQAIRGILVAPRIAGLRQHQGVVIGEASWPAILDMTTWEQVCTILNDPSRIPAPPSRKYPLRGVLWCADCNRKLTVKPRKDRHTGAVRRTYDCRVKDHGGCGLQITADAVEGEVFRRVRKLVESPKAREIVKQAEASGQDQVRRLVAENADDERKLSEYTEMLDADDMDPKTYGKLSRSIRARIEQRHQELADLQGQTALDRLGSTSWNELTAEDKRSITMTFFPKIRVARQPPVGNRFNPDRLSFTWNWPAMAEASAAMFDETDPETVASWEDDQDLGTA